MRSSIASLQQHHVAAPLLQTLTSIFSSALVEEGEQYAQAGQVLSATAAAGFVRGDVQGVRKRAEVVEIDWPQWDETAWLAIATAINQQPAIEAGIRAGLQVDSLVALLNELVLELIPSAEEWQKQVLRCSCGQSSCWHLCATFLLVIEKVHEDPLQLLLLRGRSIEQLLELLQQQRQIQTHGRALAHAELALEDHQQSLALEDLLPVYWARPRPHRDEAATSIQRYAPHALLKRLGPSPLPGRFPIVGLLASVYDEVAQDITQRIARLAETPQNDDDDTPAVGDVDVDANIE
ncbi:MAG: hypothetical protein ACR2GY_04790 [Phycisphaerales bacterium]